MKSFNRTPSLRLPATALAALTLTPFVVAQTPPVSGTYPFGGSTTFNTPGRQTMPTTSFTTEWRLDDGVTVTVSNADATANGGVFDIEGTTSNTLTFTIGPSGTNGRAIFRDNITSGEGGVIYQTRATLDFTNVSFIGNGSTKTSGHGGGALRIGSTALGGKFSNVLFDRNFALSTGGAIRTLHGIEIESAAFTNNYAAGTGTTGYGGAIGASSGGLSVANNGIQQSVITNSTFGGNWASRYGGAIGVQQHHSLNFFDHVGFDDNFASVAGGAFYDVANTGLLIGGNALIDGQRFVFTGTSGVRDYQYSGNVARGVEMTEDEIAAARLGDGSFDFKAGAEAKAGGFYFADAENTRLRFDIAEGVTVSIGEAGNPSAWDSIANSDDSGTTARIDLIETSETPAPGGTLILHADNSYFQGAVNVSKGTLLLGNQNAKLGGAITVADGRTFGGAGELITHKQDGSVFAGRSNLAVGNNARIQVGTDTASTGETLSVAGNINAGSGVVFSHDLFSDGSASTLLAENISLAGPATINLGLLASGTFKLIEWTGTGLESAFSNLSLTVDGVQNNPRANASISLDGKSLLATATVNNLVMKWTGAEGSVWSRRTSTAQQNWADTGGTGQSKYFSGDSVMFDGVADAANPANRVITIDASGVTLSGMSVTGAERYEFRGAGGIEVDAAAIGNATFTPTGKLTKSGAGELAFSNTGANTFEGGIELAGGTITFDRPAQLGAGTAGIVFSDSATLRATSAVSGTLAEPITVAAGKNAELRVDDGGTLTYSGTLKSGGAGAALRKTGDGTVRLTGDNSANTVALAVDAGSVTLAEASAAIGGAITVNSGATLGGVGTAGTGGSVKVAAGGILDVGVDDTQPSTLTVNNLELAGGAVIKVDLFKTPDGAYQQSDRIIGTGTSAISGSNLIDLTSFAAGTFNLGDLTGLVVGTQVTLSGMTLPADGRLSADLSNSGGVLKLVMTSDQSRELTWTGGANSTWNVAATNWTDKGAVNQFGYGDRVLFDGTAAAGSRNIVVDASEVRVADMRVSGNEDHTFTGGGIHAAGDNLQDGGTGSFLITDATGKLTKTGTGVLTFANAQNTFLGGVDLADGVVAINNGNQLTTSNSTGIAFTGDAVLRATADLVIADDIAVGAGKIGTIDSAGYGVTLKGTIVGATNATFAKDGAGTVLLESDLSDFDGTLAARNGTLRVGAADQLTNGGQSAIVVNGGATLDLNGHDQSIANLSGTGTVALGSAALTYTADAEETFVGSFTGSGSVAKQGAGKWTLAGNSSHTGGVILQAGELGLASTGALGTGKLTVAASAGKVSIETDGLNIPNAIAGGSGTLTLESGGHTAEFSGDINGSTVVLAGSGTLALSGTNTISALEVDVPLAIARRAESIGSSAVSINDGSTLEFRGVETGQVNGDLSGDRVLITSSTLALAGANALQALDIASGSSVTAASSGALGGPTTNVTVRDGASLLVPMMNTPGGNVRVDGGALVFGAPPPLGSNEVYGTQGSLELAGVLEFANGGEVRLGGNLPTGIYTAAVAAGGITGVPAYDPHQDNVFMVADVENDTLRITAYNKALEPGKDIIVGYSALSATTRAVSAHLSEDFIHPLTDDKMSPGASRPNSVWFRAIGSYQEYGDDREHLGFKDKTIGGIVGYDWISTNQLMLGGYVGQSVTDIETSNKATTDMDLPYAGLYAAKRFGRFFVSADVSAGIGKADTERTEEFGNLTKGSYKLDSLGGNLEVGYLVPLFANGGIRPSVGLSYMDLSFHDHAETGQGAVRLDDLGASLLQGVARIEATKNIKMPWGRPGVIGLNVAWRQAIDSERTSVWATLVDYPDARIQIQGDEYDADSITTGLTVRMMLTEKTTFALAYDYESAPFADQNSGTGRHTFNSVVRMSW